MSKEIIEKAVSKAGKAITDLIKVYELHGADLSDREFAIGFAHLQRALALVGEKASLARSVAMAGKFTFDAVDSIAPSTQAPIIIPTQTMPGVSLTPAAPAPGTVVMAQPPRQFHTARLSKHAAEPNAGKPVSIPISVPGAIDDMLDADTKVRFFDENEEK